jgi:molecular chaperone HtpG
MAKASAKSTPVSEKIPFSAEISRVLHLMIHSLYTNKDIFLRELVSNASDACDKLRYLSLSDQSLVAGDTELRITLRIDEKARTIEVRDNGIGMNREDMIAHLGTIAKSGTGEFLNEIATQGGTPDANLIGQFGVGFYSSFIVAGEVEVFSRKAGESQAYVWRSAGDGEFTVDEAPERPRGTSILLHVREDAKEYLDKFKLSHIVETYSDHIAFPIFMEVAGEDGEAERVNQGSALWTRQKSEVTPEQYQEFYHHVAHSPDEPWLTIHNKVEGKLSYTNLLFIPSMKPFDLFHPERRRRVKLYVKRVFISDENVDLVPHYLRFLRGVIDSEDLPLNISRETLQDNPLLRQIRESITSRVLTELKKKADADPEGFLRFWNHFGAVLKEGLCEATSPRDKLLDVCRFHSTEGPSPISLEDYASRMKEGQEEIFYLTGDSLDAMRKSPLLEGFTARGIEVLLFADHVDDFWVSVVHEFKGKKLKSITRSNIDLDKFGASDAKPTSEEATGEAPDAEKMAALVSLLKQTFGEDIKDVRTTSKLTGSPACLAVDEHDMDMRMERFLVEHRQLPRRSAKILEINPSHPLIRAMAARIGEGSATADVEDAAFLLLDQAKIVEGETISDPAAFARRLSRFMEKGIVS